MTRFGQILTEEEWALLEKAEAPLYKSEGMHAFTSVRYREESQALRIMWDDAFASAEMMYDHGPKDTPESAHAILAKIQWEVAQRVALAQSILVFGTDGRVMP